VIGVGGEAGAGRVDEVVVQDRAGRSVLGVEEPPAECLKQIVARALERSGERESRAFMLDAVRRLEGQQAAADLLRTEMGSEDRARAKAAEELLVDLGGWAAVQRLRERRTTLEDLDKLLKDSEKVVRDSFDSTMRHAKTSFQFAMLVNALIVAVGVVLIGVAISQVIGNPDRLSSWLLPGAAGVFGILANQFFNDPRRNAQEDLRALMNVNVIFLGFIRKVNQIDATFKHAYMEEAHFNTTNLAETVGELEGAVQRTLQASQAYLAPPSRDPRDSQKRAAREAKQAEETTTAPETPLVTAT
jgi:hypothetical protein